MPGDETLSVEFELHHDARATPFLFVAFESSRPLAGSARHSLLGIDEIAIGRGDPLVERAAARLRLRFSDARLSGEHATITRRADGFVLTDLESKNGSHVNGTAQHEAVLRDRDSIELGGTFFIFRSIPVSADHERDLREDGRTPRAAGLATVLPGHADQLARFAQVCASTLPIVVVGETGTGKELAARAAHELSGRKRAFVPVNCGALTPTLLEAELFGHKRGAFSGATEDRPGLFRASDGGTLFLDEIVELPLAGQAALLRALQEREVRAVGEIRTTPVDLRVVCATQRSLEEAVDAGGFRADLYARLSGFVLRLPPLRERREDLGLLTATLLRRLAGERAGQIPPGRDGGAAAARRSVADEHSRAREVPRRRPRRRRRHHRAGAPGALEPARQPRWSADAAAGQQTRAQPPPAHGRGRAASRAAQAVDGDARRQHQRRGARARQGPRAGPALAAPFQPVLAATIAEARWVWSPHAWRLQTRSDRHSCVKSPHFFARTSKQL